MITIEITNHAIEEYLNDNKKEKNPKKKLQTLLVIFWGNNAKRFYKPETGCTVIRMNDQAIVYRSMMEKVVVITYYRIFHINIEKRKKSIKKQINEILSGKAEVEIRKRVIRKQERKIDKENKRARWNDVFRHSTSRYKRR